MIKKLIVARHGNTFEPHETPTRVGKNTDLKLVKKGQDQAKKLGKTLMEFDLIPNTVFSSNLKRTQETAHIACDIMGIKPPIQTRSLFDEIDYGVDENMSEDVVTKRIGTQAITDWDERAVVPDGWSVNPDAITKGWHDFAAEIIRGDHKTTLVVTSNGVARFAPHITGDFEDFRDKHPLKLRTGAYGIFEYSGGAWTATCWDERP